MNHRTRTIRSALALLLLAGVLALSGCGSAPLPPLLIARAERSASAQPAAPAANAAVVAAAAPTESAPAAAAPTESAPAEAAPTETPATAAAAAVAGQVITPTVAGGQASAVVAAPTATRVAPTATRVAPAATRAPARPAATPTPEWPKSLTITADDIEQGAASVPGLQVTGLDVQFASDSMTLSFDSLRYSFVSMRNVTVQGHFTVNNCDVEFVADSINPRNLATSAIPGFVNQSLDQQLAPWCVESLAVQPGQLVVSVRPR